VKGTEGREIQCIEECFTRDDSSDGQRLEVGKEGGAYEGRVRGVRPAWFDGKIHLQKSTSHVCGACPRANIYGADEPVLAIYDTGSIYATVRYILLYMVKARLT
jgi:hypothetical protein